MVSQKLFDALKEKKADAIISESQQTRKWYTGISTSDGWLIIESNKEATLFVDGRYIEYAKNNAKNVKVNLLKKDSLQKWLIDKKFKKIAIEGDYLTIEKKDFLKKILQETKTSITTIIHARNGAPVWLMPWRVLRKCYRASHQVSFQRKCCL